MLKAKHTFGYNVVKTILYVLLTILAVICLLPFLMMVVNATRTSDEIVKGFTLIPGTALAHNWAVVFDYFNLFKGMLNSLIVAAPATLLGAYFPAMAAFGLACYKFKGNNTIFWVILIFMMIPGTLSLIGFYQLCSALHMTNTYYPLILPAIAGTGTVFFLRQYIISSLSPSLLEAARIDGASEMYMFHRIAIPIVFPAIATFSIMGFIGNWNSYLLPMIILNDPKKYTLPVQVVSLRASTDITENYGAIYLCIAISMIPIILVFITFSKYIISSVSAGAVKE
ncbi:carbohydrate ABC transporter permease [Butyrivibrio sp. MC2013]|uniref:carbohydrate ABC transporter permease n=1 Tax=Butyrivibrio sp. MC2013 TaxID=1280686 RepID=UPI000420243B|nr:carbohydrate ABC transporter permease [Butyrivibrio sp. MC2013]